MEKIRVTIIEDNKYTAKVIAKNLKRSGFEINDIFNSAEEALESLNEFTSDVIISDLKLSTELNGLHAGERIRELINTPIVFYSGTVNNIMIDSCLALGNARFIAKTSPITEVISAVEELLSANDLRKAS